MSKLKARLSVTSIKNNRMPHVPPMVCPSVTYVLCIEVMHLLSFYDVTIMTFPYVNGRNVLVKMSRL